MREILYTIAFCVMAMITTSAFSVNAEDYSERHFRILFISSYGYSNPGVPDQLKGFEEGIDGINVDISYEFMDAERFYGATDISNFDKYIKYKIYTLRDYDLVAVADDPALRYAINSRSDLFPDVPMVFMGINNKTEAITAAAMKKSTGIAENPDFETNFKLMSTLFPKRKHYVVVVDSTVTGQGDYVEFMKYKDQHGGVWSTIINTSYYTKDGLKRAFSKLGEEDVVLFLDFSVDGENNSYSLGNASEFLHENAKNVPVFRLSSSNIGHGVLGGVSYSYYDAGRIAGQAAKEILLGANPDRIGLMASEVSTAYFEQGQMDKFGIKYSDLPEGSVVINEHQNLAKFYRENRIISNLTIIIILLMLVIIGLLFVANKHRAKMIRTDFLTQIPNRKKMMDDINLAIENNLFFGIVMMDVDHFKAINDTYGHKIGDEVIQETAARLQKLARKDLIFARLGGDEFCGIFYSPSEKKAVEICESIIDMMKEGFKTSQGTLSITVSIGCALYPSEIQNPRKVVECADSALYKTKERGRNGYTLFSSIDKSG